MSNECAISQRIRDWFQGEKQNWGHQQSTDVWDEIAAMVKDAPEAELTESAVAWKAWNDFEDDYKRVDPGCRIAMDLCKYTEWCADKALGLTDEPFEGVPHLVISFA